MTLFRVPSDTVCLQLLLDRLNESSAHFTHFDGSTTVTLDRKWWEGAGRPAQIEIPVTKRLEGPLAEPSDAGGES